MAAAAAHIGAIHAHVANVWPWTSGAISHDADVRIVAELRAAGVRRVFDSGVGGEFRLAMDSRAAGVVWRRDIVANACVDAARRNRSSDLCDSIFGRITHLLWPRFLARIVHDAETAWSEIHRASATRTAFLLVRLAIEVGFAYLSCAP